MKYLLLVYTEEKSWTDEERARCYAESSRLCQELEAGGQLLSANPLHSVESATSVRVRNGKPVLTDGPFAETREQLGGYYLVDAASLDDALRIAARIPGARKGTIEVRPVLDLPVSHDFQTHISAPSL